MAKVDDGQIGGFRGKIGRIVVASYRREKIGRAVPKAVTKPATLKQLAQRARFALVASFVNGLGALLDITFKVVKGNALPVHMAVKKNLEVAVTGVYPNFTINFPAVVISQAKNNSKIENVMPIAMTALANGRVTLSWEAGEAGRVASLPTDQLYVIMYNATADYFMNYPIAATRSQLSATLRTPHEDESDKVHVWVLYVSADQQYASKSSYLGQIL